MKRVVLPFRAPTKAIRLLLALAATWNFVSACSDSAQDIRIAAQDYRFQPSEIHLQADRPIRLTLVNEGREAHEVSSTLFLRPEVRPIDDQVGPPFTGRGLIKINVGGSATVTLRAPVGTYFYRCVIPGHRGMEGMLIVE
ncbi:MAG: cupredoxin domain-containing protein [Nitrospirae bacterium]|nr:cupredoxin domain-containing protein [Nitrospirota bacterium]